MTVRSVGEEVLSEFELNLIKTKFTIGLLKDLPALIWCISSDQLVLERAELQFSANVATEVSSEDQAGSNF